MVGSRRQWKEWGTGVAILALSATSALARIEINPAGWKFPNVITAAKEMIRPSERTPLIPGKETLLKGYRKPDGTHFMTYEIEGRVFGVQIDTDGKPPFEYSIMDTDGDGKFETKIIPEKGGKDVGYVPQWIIDYYYSKHPELPKPEGKAGPPMTVSKPQPPVLTAAPRPLAAPTPAPQPSIPPPEIVSQPSP